MLGDIKGGFRTTALGLVGIAAIGAGLHAQSEKRVRATAQRRAIEALNSAPEYSKVNPDRLLALLSSDTSPFSRSDLIKASKVATDLDVDAALARVIYNGLPFDGDNDATKKVAYLVLEAGMRACNADEAFKAEVASTQLLHLVQKVHQVSQGQTEIKESLAEIKEQLSGQQLANEKLLTEQLQDKADALQVTKQLFISLARRIVKDVTDIDQAHRELERVIEVAGDEQAKNTLSANTDETVTTILVRVDELNNAGQIKEAAIHLVEEEEHVKTGLARIYDKGIAQAILTRDADAACDYELKKITLDTSESAEQFDTRHRVWCVWFERGRDQGLNFDLEVSIKLARANLTRAGDTKQRGMAQNDLGNSLRNLGDRESGTERLEEAIVAYRSALEERTRDRVPLDWAKTQNDLGNALQALGMREIGTERLEEAIVAYRSALEERTRDRVPLDWAMTQNNLGAAFESIGDREGGTERLKEAVVAYRAALEDFPRDREPHRWAAIQNNFGKTLRNLGDRESDTKYLEEAIAAYRAALEEYSRDCVPLDWAMVQNNLGVALKFLGEREIGTERLEEAIVAYRAALEERTRDRAPLLWAFTCENLALAMQVIADHPTTTDPRSYVEAALEYVDGALEVYNVDQTPFDHGTATRLREQLFGRLASDD